MLRYQPDLLDEADRFPIVQARLQNHGPATSIQSIKTRDYGRLLTVRGTVVRISGVRPACTWLAFECVACHAVQSVHQPYGKLMEPVKCIKSGCRGRKFVALRGHKYTLTQDWQSVRLQEVVQHDDASSGRVPRTIEAELTEDLCDVAMPGDVITLTGVVRNATLPDKRSGSSLFQLYLRALTVKNEKSRSSRQAAGAGRAASANKSGIQFTIEDYSVIQEIEALGPQLFKLMVHSLCPSIYGHETVKAGLLLGLFGGASRYKNDKAHLSVRGDPHVSF